MNVVVIGTGYVGLVAACCLANSGHNVFAVDKDKTKLRTLENARVPFYEEGLDDLLKKAIAANKISFSDNLASTLRHAQIVIIAVGTPSLASGRVDLSQVHAVMHDVIEHTTAELTVVMKSTVPPGTGRVIAQRYLTNSRVPIHYVSNPEFLREGKAVWDWYHPDRIVIGCDEERVAGQVLQLYADIDAPKMVMDVTSAEMVKYTSNAFLATKISFINEIANLCEVVGADIDKVAEATGMDRRIGPHFLQAGLGYGGSCFPKDTKGLDHISSFNGYRFSLLKAVIEVNAHQRILAVRKLKAGLGELFGKRIAVLGLAFKPGTDDVREAPALEIIKYLVDEGAEVRATDPLATTNARPWLPASVKLTPDLYEALRDTEACLLATEWPQFTELDWKKVKDLMKEPYLVVDGRNVLNGEEITRLGFRYFGFGRARLA